MALLCGSAAISALGGGWAVLAAPDGRWLAQGLRGRLFLLCGAITLGGAGVLALLGTALWLAGAPHRLSARRQAGSATLEFALVLPIALMIVLMMTQSSLLMGGNLCVNYAAFCAARSAVVNVPRSFPPDEPANVVSDPISSAKLQRMRLAAVWALLPVSCSSSRAPSKDPSQLQAGLEYFFGASGMQTPSWVYGNLGQRLRHAEEHTTVELAPPARAARYGPNEDLRVSLRHDLYLAVPYAAAIFGRLASDGMKLDFAPGEYATVVRSSCTLSNEGAQDYVDVEEFPQSRTRRN